jgi:hypothetical protein
MPRAIANNDSGFIMQKNLRSGIDPPPYHYPLGIARSLTNQAKDEDVPMNGNNEIKNFGL